MAKIIGIDLGTSTSEVAVFKDGKPQLILDENGKKIILSAVGIDENGEFLVGERAKERFLLDPEHTAIEIKRKIGTDEMIRLGEKEFTPAELSSKILKKLKNMAEEYLGETVEKAVITVPAYFNNQQRQETMQAGQLAGLTVERIINEPTAAALCYGIDHMEEESHVLVYDFGGGTFDVTLLEMFDGVLEVKASSGNNKLGGKDFDEIIMNVLIERCKEQYRVDLRQDLYAMVKLKEEAEKCKIALSSQDKYEILLPMISQKDGILISIDEIITVEEFENWIKELVGQTESPVRTVLADAKIHSSDIDRVLLSGGTTRVPYIKRYVEDLLDCIAEEAIDPDLAVVMGASIQAAMINGEVDTQSGLMLTDVAPYPLGVRVAIENMFGVDTDCMDILIPRNVTIPVTKEKEYQTMGDNQTWSNLEIYQGEDEKASANYCLGKFILSGIPPKKAGKEKIGVKFSYDLNGILDVKATVVSTGKTMDITIETAGIHQETADTSKWRESKNASKFRSTIRKAEKLEMSGDIIQEEDQEDLQDMIEELKLALINEEDLEEIEMLEEELLDFIDELEE